VAELSIKNGKTPYRIKWFSSNPIDCDTCQQVIIKVIKEGRASYKLIDANGCSEMSEFPIELKGGGILFPNVIKTNSSEEYSSFNPKNYLPNEAVLKSISIYDRWGNVVYYNQNIDPNWQGIDFRTQLINIKSGVFVYFLEFEINAQIYQKSGDLLILK
jgi:hypothetical protein